MKKLLREGEAFITGPQESLCVECGVLDCEKRGDVQSCSEMQPIISMRDMIGTDKRVFNTMRLYGAWAKRLRAGDPVVLTCKEERLECVVVRTESGPFDDIFLQHAHMNHTALGTPDEHHVPVVYDAIVKSYGKNWVLRCGYLSVIYLTPAKGM